MKLASILVSGMLLSGFSSGDAKASTALLADTVTYWTDDITIGDVTYAANNHWYAIVAVAGAGNINWQDARDAAFGGHLVTFSNAGENEFVWYNIADAYNGASGQAKSYWLGAYQDPIDEGKKYNWHWVADEEGTIWQPYYQSPTLYAANANGSGATSYANWANGEPNDSFGLESYLQYYKNQATGSNKGKWNDEGNYFEDPRDNPLTSHYIVEGVGSPVPLPPSVILLGGGLLGIIGFNARKRKG